MDMNKRRSGSSPLRKRAKYNTSKALTKCKKDQNWTFFKNGSKIDDLVEFGVSKLEDDELDHSQKCYCVDLNGAKKTTKTQMPNKGNEKQRAVLQATLSKQTLQKLTSGNIEDLLNPNNNGHSSAQLINYFEYLSDEVVLHIFGFLPKRFLNHIMTVCRRWQQLVEDESLWARMDVSNRRLLPGVMGKILGRQAVVLRLAQSEILCPPILPNSRAMCLDFKARLQYLDLSMAHASTETLAMIFNKCVKLKKVSLEHVLINEEVLVALSGNNDLEVLNLAMAEGITLDGLVHLLMKCCKLKELNLAWSYLTSNCIHYICESLPLTMDRLNLSGCRKQLSDDDVANLVVSCPNMRELDLSDCTEITGSSMEHVSSLEELNFLAISRCYLIQPSSLLCLKKLKSLSYLDIHGGYISNNEMKKLQDNLGARVHLNKFKFSSVARPTVGIRRSSIWGLRVKD